MLVVLGSTGIVVNKMKKKYKILLGGIAMSFPVAGIVFSVVCSNGLETRIKEMQKFYEKVGKIEFKNMYVESCIRKYINENKETYGFFEYMNKNPDAFYSKVKECEDEFRK